MGKAFAAMEKGDNVALSLSLQLPMLIRSDMPNFRFVGPVYAEGLVNGEALLDLFIIQRLRSCLRSVRKPCIITI